MHRALINHPGIPYKRIGVIKLTETDLDFVSQVLDYAQGELRQLADSLEQRRAFVARTRIEDLRIIAERMYAMRERIEGRS